MVDATRSLVLALVLLIPAGAATFDSAVEPLDSAAPLEDTNGLVRVIVSFDTHEDMDRFLAEQPFFVAYEAKVLPTLILDVPHGVIEPLRAQPGVLAVEQDRLLPLHLENSTQAIRADAVWGDALDGPILHPETGEVIDGTGVGVAVLDTGIDATHPDLKERVVRNMAVVVGDVEKGLAGHFTGGAPLVGQPIVMIEGENMDEEGHGTHVAGTVAGEAVASNNTHKGVAPGASLYGIDVSHGQAVVLTQTVAAWDWVLEHHDQVDPPIRVVNNSYGCGTSNYREDFVSNRQVDKAVEQGIVVVYAVGNDGGDGSTDETGGCANNPRVLGVASYNDEGTGTRDASLSWFSSRGDADDPTTWPDISAPGEQIVAPAASLDAVSLLFRSASAFSGFFEIVIDETPSGQQPWYFGAPAAVYNAHEATFVVEPRDPPLVENFPPFTVDEEAAQNMRFYSDAGVPVGPVYPSSASQSQVGPGDRIEFRYDSSIASHADIRIAAPTGETVQTSVSFIGCGDPCTADVDLHELFPGVPADGTWTLTFALYSGMSADSYIGKSGTSMAAPHVAGVAALMLQANPGLTPKDVTDIMQTTAHKFDYGGGYETLSHRSYVNSSFDKGAGLVDAHAAVLASFDWEPIQDQDPDLPPESPPPENQTEVHALQGSGLVRANCWTQVDCADTLGFEVHEDAVGILVQMRWEADVAQQVDIRVRSPNQCPMEGLALVAICILQGAVLKQEEGTYFGQGEGVPATQGEVWMWLDEATVQSHDCGESWCRWSATPVPDAAVGFSFEARVTTVNWGELPDGYSAFDD